MCRLCRHPSTSPFHSNGTNITDLPGASAALQKQLDEAQAEKAALSNRLDASRESADREIAAVRAELRAAREEAAHLAVDLEGALRRVREAEEHAAGQRSAEGAPPAGGGVDQEAFDALKRNLEQTRGMLVDALAQKRRLNVRSVALSLSCSFACSVALGPAHIFYLATSNPHYTAQRVLASALRSSSVRHALV